MKAGSRGARPFFVVKRRDCGRLQQGRDTGLFGSSIGKKWTLGIFVRNFGRKVDRCERLAKS